MNEQVQPNLPEAELEAKLKTNAAPLALMIHDKGGVGKSILTATIYEFHFEPSSNLVATDLDTGNSDC